MSKRNRLPFGVRSVSGRKLRVESLETRRLLAGDFGHDQQVPSSDGGLDSLDEQSVQVAGTTFQAADAAGSTRASAADLGTVEGTIRRGGRLSWSDRVDMIRFNVASDSRVQIALDQLTWDADLYVVDADGRLIASSTRDGFRSESLSGTLAEGDYYLAVVATSFRTMSYRLTLGVESIAPQPSTPQPSTPQPSTPQPSTPQPSTPEPEANEPEPERRAPTTPSPAPGTPISQPDPSTVAPLSEVAYFGGSRDWNLNAVAAPEAWAAGYTGAGVTVAVIDTGVDLDHPDLVGNLFVNAGEIAGNGIDDDGNGYVDDVHGYDFVSRDARPDDGNGHGTHVAGTIAAANNGVGATGVAPDATILPVRVLDDSGRGSDSSVAAGIRYAAEMGAEIINLSLGGGASSRIAQAIEYAVSLGSLVVAAAGNESAPVPSYPARHSAELTSVISVGAFDSRDRIAGFSNDVGGSGSTQVDAPGVSVYSTYVGGGYRSLSGTSMASPHVAGVAALTLSANPDLTSPELRTLLTDGTIGSSIGSDSIGKVSTLQTVAYAAAGLTMTAASGGAIAAAGSVSTSGVRTTGNENAFVQKPILVGNDSDLVSRIVASQRSAPELLVVSAKKSSFAASESGAIDAFFAANGAELVREGSNRTETLDLQDLGDASGLA